MKAKEMGEKKQAEKGEMEILAGKVSLNYPLEAAGFCLKRACNYTPLGYNRAA